MAHILAFTSAPRSDSISTAMVHIAVQAAMETGCTVEYIDLTAAQPQCCKGCRHCRTHDGCSIPDGLYEKLVSCDGIIIGFPIYFSGIAGQAKVLLDRLYPMMDAGFVPRHPGKKVIAIYAQGDPREQAFAAAIKTTDYVFRMCGWQQLDSILCAGTAAEGYTIPDALIDRAKAAGGKF